MAEPFCYRIAMKAGARAQRCGCRFEERESGRGLLARISFVWGERCQARRANPTGFATSWTSARQRSEKRCKSHHQHWSCLEAIMATHVTPAVIAAFVVVRGDVRDVDQPT